MLIKEAVEKRIVELCNERGIAINALANISGVSPSTVYSILNEKSVGFDVSEILVLISFNHPLTLPLGKIFLRSQISHLMCTW